MNFIEQDWNSNFNKKKHNFEELCLVIMFPKIENDVKKRKLPVYTRSDERWPKLWWLIEVCSRDMSNGVNHDHYNVTQMPGNVTEP